MMPNINSRQMQQMMRKMGIDQEDLDASEVIIKCPDKTIRITNPSVQRVKMQGSINYQISGPETIEAPDAEEESTISDEDIETVMEQASCSQDEAIAALEETNGDIAEAILKLSEGKN